MSVSALSSMAHELTLDLPALLSIAREFAGEIRRGLRGEPSSLKCIPAHISLPSGSEQGDVIGLDFGGTNVRAVSCRLHGSGRMEILRQYQKSLHMPGVYSYIGSDTTAEELFDVLAGAVKEVWQGSPVPLLGYTFSFPSRQPSLQEAYLLSWTKEFAVPHAEGKNVSVLLEQALERAGISLSPAAVINDTTAVLLTGQYECGNILIGSIYGTGHNTAYYETSPAAGDPTIINLECGNFDRLLQTAYDQALDQFSEKPGQQRLEKMVSGRYIERLLTYCMTRLFPQWQSTISCAQMNGILENTLPCPPAWSAAEYRAAGELSRAILTRSAQLAAASYAGILFHVYGETAPIPPAGIAIDGSLYAHIPLIQETIRDTLALLLGNRAEQVSLHYVPDGSAKGAAIAACWAQPALG